MSFRFDCILLIPTSQFQPREGEFQGVEFSLRHFCMLPGPGSDPVALGNLGLVLYRLGQKIVETLELGVVDDRLVGLDETFKASG